MRIELILDVRASEAPWQVLVNGKRTEPPLTTPEEVIERLANLGIDPPEARFHANCLTHTTPYYEFEVPARA